MIGTAYAAGEAPDEPVMSIKRIGSGQVGVPQGEIKGEMTMKTRLLATLGVLVSLNLLLIGNATPVTAQGQDMLPFDNCLRLTEVAAPEIVGVHMSIHNHIQGTGEACDSYGFETFVDAVGDFSSFEASDIRISVNGTVLDIMNVEVSQDGEVFHIAASGDFGGVPPFGEYEVSVEDASGQTSERVIGVLKDFPKDAPELLFPQHLELITETQPTFSWEAFESVYTGEGVAPWGYEINLHFPNGDVFSVYPIAGSQTSLNYQNPDWDPSQPPNLLPGGYHLTVHSNHNVAPGFSFEHHRTIHFEVPVVVKIDIKPGSDPNSINPKSKGVIPVAILTTEDFDATSVDALSVEFGPDGATESHGQGHIEDVDGDGDLDLVLHFRTQETGIGCGDSSASVTGRAFGKQAIEGSDSINTVGCR
jgi:hypothetical protein